MSKRSIISKHRLRAIRYSLLTLGAGAVLSCAGVGAADAQSLMPASPPTVAGNATSNGGWDAQNQQQQQAFDELLGQGKNTVGAAVGSLGDSQRALGSLTKIPGSIDLPDALNQYAEDNMAQAQRSVQTGTPFDPVSTKSIQDAMSKDIERNVSAMVLNAFSLQTIHTPTILAEGARGLSKAMVWYGLFVPVLVKAGDINRLDDLAKGFVEDVNWSQLL